MLEHKQAQCSSKQQTPVTKLEHKELQLITLDQIIHVQINSKGLT